MLVSSHFYLDWSPVDRHIDAWGDILLQLPRALLLLLSRSQFSLLVRRLMIRLAPGNQSRLRQVHIHWNIPVPVQLTWPSGRGPAPPPWSGPWSARCPELSSSWTSSPWARPVPANPTGSYLGAPSSSLSCSDAAIFCAPSSSRTSARAPVLSSPLAEAGLDAQWDWRWLLALAPSSHNWWSLLAADPTWGKCNA